MSKETINNVRLGLFISSGMVILIVSLYLIGKNQSFFGATFHLKARFANVNGLLAGNNVRYSGIQAGTVSKIEVIDDTTIEVTLMIDKKMKPFIHRNSFAAIGNDGLMGNKVINITPNNVPAPEMPEGGLLFTKKGAYTDEMIETLSSTNNNIEVISENLKIASIQLNKNNALWSMLNDTTIAVNLSVSLANVHQAAVQINTISRGISEIVTDVHKGKGTVGALLNDEKMSSDLKQAISNLNQTTQSSEVVIHQIDSFVRQVQADVANGRGPAHAILRDSLFTVKINNSLSSIEKGTEAFNQDMEALKHNFLTRPYFRKEAKRNRKQQNRKVD